jgi:transposase
MPARPPARAPSARCPAGGHWKRLTVLGALGLEDVVASMSIAAATTGAVFLAFVKQVLIPALRGRSGAIVVVDNLGAHKAEQVRSALAAAKIAHRYLPSYSPDLNPIEPCWSKLKGTLPAKAVRTREVGAGSRTRPGAGHDHRPGRAGLVPALRLQPSQLLIHQLYT